MSSKNLSPVATGAPAPPTLVLLPGMDGTGTLFRPLLAALGDRCGVTVVDYPTKGHPQSYADLQKVAEIQLPPDGPIVLLGESFSGPIAVSLAAAHPDRVVGVILCCTFLRNPRPGVAWLSGLLALPAPRPPLAIISAALYGSFETEGLRAMVRDALAPLPSATIRDRLRAVAAVDVSIQAHAIEAPVLYLQARSDRLVPAAACDVAQQCIRKFRVEAFDAPHCLLQVVPESAAMAIAGFVEQFQAAQCRGMSSLT